LILQNAVDLTGCATDAFFWESGPLTSEFVIFEPTIKSDKHAGEIKQIRQPFDVRKPSDFARVNIIQLLEKSKLASSEK
jgi:hypothetical protein